MSARKEQRVPPYTDGLMQRIELSNYRTYEYRVPFNYENVRVERRYNCGETHGMELNAVSSYWPEPERRPADYIEIAEDDAIVQVDVLGSACTPPGYVQLMAEPIEGFRRSDEPDMILPVRFRINNLWGMHLRVDQWAVEDVTVPRFVGEGPFGDLPGDFKEKNPSIAKCRVKSDHREFPLTGMSCAIFSIPLSKKVRIMGGCENPGWTDDNFPDDVHYSFRIIRVTVCDHR